MTDPAPTEAGPRFSDDEAGLRAMLLHTAPLIQRAGPEEFESRAARLQLPNAAEWFERVVGGPLGVQLAAGQPNVYDIVFKAFPQRGAHVEVRRAKGPDDEEASWTQRALHSILREPVEIFTTWYRHSDPSVRVLPGWWAFVAGHWRFLGTMLAAAAAETSATRQFWERHFRYPLSGDPSHARFPETTDGLITLIEAILDSCNRVDEALFSHFVGTLHLPNSEAWYREVFVDPDASFTGPTGSPTTLLTDHHDADARLESELDAAFRRYDSCLEVRAVCLVDAKIRAPQSGPMAMRRPWSLYAVAFHHPDDSPEQGVGLMPLVFVEGAWRLLGGLWDLESIVAEQLFARLGQRR